MTQPDDLSQVVTDEGVCLCGCTENCAVVAELRQRIRSQDSVIKRMVSEEPAPTPAEARGEGEEHALYVEHCARKLRGHGSRVSGNTLDEVAAFIRTLARQLAEAKAELHKRTDSVIVAGGVALACSVAVKEAFDLQQAQLAQATARLAAVEGLVQQWRDGKDIDGYNAPSDARQWMRDCADELEIALKQKEPTHAPE